MERNIKHINEGTELKSRIRKTKIVFQWHYTTLLKNSYGPKPRYIRVLAQNANRGSNLPPPRRRLFVENLVFLKFANFKTRSDFKIPKTTFYKNLFLFHLAREASGSDQLLRAPVKPNQTP